MSTVARRTHLVLRFLYLRGVFGAGRRHGPQEGGRRASTAFWAWLAARWANACHFYARCAAHAPRKRWLTECPRRIIRICDRPPERHGRRRPGTRVSGRVWI